MNIERNWDGPRRVLLTIDDYALLDRSGALAEYGRTELIEGVIVAMNAQFRPHARMKMQLVHAFSNALKGRDDRLEILSEASVAVPPRNMPEPDIVLTTEPDGDGPVPAASVKLIVEISNDTLKFDLGEKAVLYACGGIPEYWVVDLNGGRVVRMWAPSDNGYGRRDEVALGERLASQTITSLVVSTER